MDFFSRLYDSLIKNDFIAGHTNSYSHPFASFTKEEGSTWHVVLIVNLEAIAFEDFMKSNNQYTYFYRNLKGSKRPNSIFITNILVTSTKSNEVNSFIQKLPPFSSDIVNNVFWGLDLQTGQLSLNETHPTQILNLREIIEDSYQDRISNVVSVAYSSPSLPILTFLVIALNIIIYYIVLTNGGITTQNLVRFGALVPELVSNGEVYRMFSAIFLHVGILHLTLNMVSLYVFGSRIEKYYSRASFALIYTFSGFLGSLGSLILSRTISVGASGAIFGLLGACAVMAKFIKKDVGGLTYQTMIIFIIINLSIGATLPNVDNFGHIGGLLGGIITSYIICRLRMLKQSKG